MAAMVLPTHRQPENQIDAQYQVSVHLQATVMAPDAVRHMANVWLSMNAGHLLAAENPELVLDDPLCWRFDVIRSLPQRVKPGAVQRNLVGRMLVDAVTGEVVDSDTLVAALTANADTLAYHAT